jgi:hypothetical protein
MVFSTALWMLSNIRFNAVMGGFLAVWMLVSFIAAETLMPAGLIPMQSIRCFLHYWRWLH